MFHRQGLNRPQSPGGTRIGRPEETLAREGELVVSPGTGRPLFPRRVQPQNGIQPVEYAAQVGDVRLIGPLSPMSSTGRPSRHRPQYVEDHATSMAPCSSASHSGRQQPGCCHAYGRKGHPHPGQHALPGDPRVRRTSGAAALIPSPVIMTGPCAARRTTSSWPAGVSPASTSSTLVIVPAARFRAEWPLPTGPMRLPRSRRGRNPAGSCPAGQIRVPARPGRYIMLTSAERRQR